MLYFFLGKAFGVLRLHGGYPFMFGQWHGGGDSYLWKPYQEGIWLWVGVVCVGVVGRWWIIYWYIARLLWSYGALFLGHLGFSGFIRRGHRSYIGWNYWFGKHLLDIWNIVSLCLMCTVWREWNWRAFEDMESTRTQLLASFTASLYEWSRTWGFTTSHSVVFYMRSHYHCICNSFVM